MAITVVPAQQNLRCRRGWLRSPLLPSNGIARGPISAAADTFTSKGALQSCESMYTTREEIGSGPGRVHRTVSQFVRTLTNNGLLGSMRRWVGWARVCNGAMESLFALLQKTCWIGNGGAHEPTCAWPSRPGLSGLTTASAGNAAWER